MASLKASADSIRANISSTSTCTTSTVSLLSDLLLPRPNSSEPTVKKAARKSPADTKTKSKVAPVKTKARKLVGQGNIGEHEEQLSPKERSILATEVINATLKSLTEAIKTSAQPLTKKQPSSKDLVKTNARKTLRRSNSMPQSPLQPRSLNRVSSSPNISTRHARSSSSVCMLVSGHRATGECARIAFACLRTIQASKVLGVDLPPLQIENGMSVLVGKLMLLGLDDLAIKEVRILKRRLDPRDTQKKTTGTSTVVPQSLSELLDFGVGTFTGDRLGLVITTQLQILRLLSLCRKTSQIEACLEFLGPEAPASPSKLLLEASKQSKEPKQLEKVARQMKSLSETLLSLCPSVAVSDDTLALESRLSICPQTAIQLQTLALHNRLFWWKITGHKGDSSKEVYDPLFRCLSTFARRSQSGALEIYRISSAAFSSTEALLLETKAPKPTGPLSLNGIYRLLGSLAKEAGVIGEAIGWVEMLKACLNPKTDSDTRILSITARLVSLYLRKSVRDPKEEELLFALLEGLERPFKGESSEIDDLIAEVVYVRRAANAILAKASAATAESALNDGLREMCESLIFTCPRLSLRYLGTPTDENSSVKEMIRYDQRRQLITMSALHSIDSSLFLIKTFSNDGRLTWDLLDSKLQDCLLLYDRLDTTTRGVVMEGGAHPPAYHVRISNMYYSHFLNMRQQPDISKDSQQFRPLRRAIDCMRGRPANEKKASFFCTKLERMAQFCKQTGRYDELLKVLSILRDELIEQGTLRTVTELATSQSMCSCWTQSEDASALGRTIQSLIKTQLKYLNTPEQICLTDDAWSDEEKAAVLEHSLAMLSNQSAASVSSNSLIDKSSRELLCIYGVKIYPIRRLRVLLELSTLNEGQCQHIVGDLKMELEPYCHGLVIVDGTSDEGLQSYLPHFSALAKTRMELREEGPRLSVLKEGLASWSAIRETCKDQSDLERKVEDVEALLAHLQILGDFFQVQGHNTVRLGVLSLITEFNQLLDDSMNANALVMSFTSLGSQWLQLGYSGKAGMALDKAKEFNHQNGVLLNTSLQLHLTCSKYLLAIGDQDKSEEQLTCAQALHGQNQVFQTTKASLTLEQVISRNLLVADAYLMYSRLAFERGTAQLALSHAKQSIRLLRRAWANTEEESRKKRSTHGTASPPDVGQITEGLSQLSVKTIEWPASHHTSASGSTFWPLIVPLFRTLNHISRLYAHHGMFQETLYYAQEAHKLVSEVGSDVYLAISSALLGSVWLRSGELDRGSQFLKMAQECTLPGTKSWEMAKLSYHTGKMQGLLGDREAEIASYDEAENALISLSNVHHIESLDKLAVTTQDIEQKLSQVVVSTRKVPIARKAPPRSKALSKKKTTVEPKSLIEPPQPIIDECPQLGSFKATILRQKARALMSLRRVREAMDLLRKANNYTTSHIETIDHGLAMARQLLLQGMEQMAADPVYSVLQDSTISFPSVAGLPKADKLGERLSVAKPSPPRKNPRSQEQSRSKSPVADGFFDQLRQAQEHLTEVYSTCIAVAPVSVIQNVSALLNSVAILLSALGQGKGKTIAHPGFASCSVETVRTIALRRERKVLNAESGIPMKIDSSSWPINTSSEARRSSVGFSNDMSRFQQSFLDIIPKSWITISISLGDSRNELSITKLQAGHSPFILRLPLGRHNSIDADEEVFGFEQGHAELQEIIQLANESAHDARDMTTKDAKCAWWEEREGLDARLRDLLENIEKVWLGGFTGIFSQHSRRADLLARFSKSFQNILDKHLPSRRKAGKRRAGPRITLDSRILELFIGLGDASDEECDFSDPLTDLLYFVVDILQFHGELNAYAEIDFDSIMVEMHDALRGYHTAVNASNELDEGRHTILILDKALHSFPWEALPCMEGLAVSRMPSLGCLRDRILKMREDMPDDVPEGQYINRNNGSFILNPSGDLKSTQTTFQKPLQALNWDGITKRIPTEEEIKSTLSSKDLYLYFGHGSGAQYIRAKEIRKLETCAVTWLMGCSSGALKEAGEFEPYGPPINYMHAGCPALVATLWDVTDKDIDRFAKATFEHWGLFGKAGSGRAKGKRMAAISEEQPDLSLVEAVAKGRSACNLKYLNAAAVCVYGVPVYFE